MLDGNTPAIFILRRILRYRAVQGGDLHSHLAPARDDRFMTARQRMTLLMARADTQRTALPKQQRPQFLLVLPPRDYGEHRAGPALLHHYRRGEDIQSAFSNCEIDDVADDLRVEVVEIRFQDRDLLLEQVHVSADGVEHRPMCLADAEPQHVGMAGEVSRSGAVADLFGGHHRSRSET